MNLSIDMQVRVSSEAVNETNMMPILDIQNTLLYDSVGSISSIGYINKGHMTRRSATARFAVIKKKANLQKTVHKLFDCEYISILVYMDMWLTLVSYIQRNIYEEAYQNNTVIRVCT